MGKRSDVIVRRTVNYGGDRPASSYLIEGAKGYRFAKCSVHAAETFGSTEAAKKALNKIRRNDPRKSCAEYEIVPLD
jgi:hypothetical protein